MWSVTITRVGNGFRMNWDEEGDDGMTIHQEEVMQDDEDDEIKSSERLLWWVMDYFAFGGSKFDEERIVITREPGDHYEPPSKSDEKA
jgi:hypothetical protein